MKIYDSKNGKCLLSVEEIPGSARYEVFGYLISFVGGLVIGILLCLCVA